MVVLLSHSPNQEQKQEAKEVWKVEKMIHLPEHLQVLWSQVPAQGDFPIPSFQPLLLWLEQNTDFQDLIWAQGEPGATFLIVSWSFQHGRVPVYATTKREYQSMVMEDGKVKNEHIFKHVAFRVYPKGEW
ncbi:CRISPR-associated protein Csx20 [Thermoflavimicrobium dichotomicum]|uniref:Uncharacterized protein n=1 Tax=Thermoflavimicrobium dichotomicum TaxID=46223 RepID=A0A1I3MHX9_9BACL|nr:CRISPR-associated protein Csx20 [Thermoflavimicrobium dichotomicum]SFI96296.1 hypothetical protein SAMN05421852_10367 [Thermoflavimicrobium dichotomicum]